MPAPKSLPVALIQHRIGDDRDANLAHSAEAIADAAAQGAKLVVLSELHTGPYFCQQADADQFDRAEPVPGPTTEALSALAAEHAVVVVGSVFERRSGGVHNNTAVVLDADGRLAGRYRKMHIPDDPGYYEKFFFTPGDLGFRPIDTTVGRLGVLVCWDQWFPEAARLMALSGAELLIYPTAIGWDPGDEADEQTRQLDAWTTVQRGHAIANGLPVLSCNRCGFEPDPGGGAGAQFWGHSFVCGPQGEWLARADTEECVLHAELDLARSERVRRIWPYMRDRRTDAYGDLLRQAID